MKNKKLILAAVLLLAAALCGTAVAYMFKVSQQQKNSFIPAQVDCSVAEKLSDNQKTEITIENTGNITAYLRLRLVTYWVNTDGEGKEYIVAKPSASLDSVQYNKSLWLKGSDDTYYYRQPVKASDGISNGHFTQNLLKSPIPLQYDDEDGSRQVIVVFAEAIQAQPAKAVEESWDIELESDGSIKAVS